MDALAFWVEELSDMEVRTLVRRNLDDATWAAQAGDGAQCERNLNVVVALKKVLAEREDAARRARRIRELVAEADTALREAKARGN